MKPSRIVTACAFLGVVMWGSAKSHGQTLAPATEASLFEQGTDIGGPASRGSLVRDIATKSYRVTGGGANIWGDRDAFYFVSTSRAARDLHVAADIAFVGSGGNPNRKAGVMIRQI